MEKMLGKVTRISPPFGVIFNGLKTTEKELLRFLANGPGEANVEMGVSEGRGYDAS